MKLRAALGHPTCKTNLTVIPDKTNLNSSNHSNISADHTSAIKKSTRSSERLKEDRESPCTPAITTSFLNTKESGRLIKNLANIQRKKNKGNFLVSSNSTTSLTTIKSLPKLQNKEKTPDLNKKSLVHSILEPKNKKLKNFEFNEELRINNLILTENHECKFKPWLDDIIDIKEKKFEGDINRDLEFCNGLIRNIIIRLKHNGKENEALLIEKIWRTHFELIDNFIEKLNSQISDLKQNYDHSMSLLQDIENVKQESAIKIQSLEEKVEELESGLSDKNSIYPEFLLKINPIISNIQSNINELSVKFNPTKKKSRTISMINSNFIRPTNGKIKNKRSVEIMKSDLLELP